MKRNLVGKKQQKGFTLVELVLYVGIFSILITVLSSIFASIVDVQLESQATSSVDQDGRYILSKLSYDMKTATAAAVPSSLGTPTSTLQLQIPGNTLNYIYSLDANGNLQLVNSSGTFVLNSYNTKLSGLTFQRIGTGGNNDTIRVNFTVTTRIPQAKGYESRSFQTTLGKQ